MAMPKCFFILVSVISIESFTITNVDPQLPTQYILNDVAFVRFIPDHESLVILCPDDTYLNEETLTCDFSNENLKVVVKNRSSHESECVPGISSTTLPAQDCRHFILCGPSGSYNMQCPGTLLFNEEIGVCDHQKDAHCCEFQEKNSSIILQNV